MLTQDVSKTPISLRTASKISRMTSGGMRRARISERDSGLMSPTASFASWTSGSISESSISIAFFLFSSFSDSSPCFCFRVSISLLDSLARFFVRKKTARGLGLWTNTCEYIQVNTLQITYLSCEYSKICCTEIDWFAFAVNTVKTHPNNSSNFSKQLKFYLLYLTNILKTCIDFLHFIIHSSLTNPVFS